MKKSLFVLLEVHQGPIFPKGKGENLAPDLMGSFFCFLSSSDHEKPTLAVHKTNN